MKRDQNIYTLLYYVTVESLTLSMNAFMDKGGDVFMLQAHGNCVLVIQYCAWGSEPELLLMILRHSNTIANKHLLDNLSLVATPLMACCQSGKTECAKILIDIGVNPWIRDITYDATALTYAQNCIDNVKDMPDTTTEYCPTRILA
jgi:hypothetical protein